MKNSINYTFILKRKLNNVYSINNNNNNPKKCKIIYQSKTKKKLLKKYSVHKD